jgi:hypothetical protein
MLTIPDETRRRAGYWSRFWFDSRLALSHLPVAGRLRDFTISKIAFMEMCADVLDVRGTAWPRRSGSDVTSGPSGRCGVGNGPFFEEAMPRTGSRRSE